MVAIEVSASDASDGYVVADGDDGGSAYPGNRAGIANADEAETLRQDNGRERAHAQFDNAGHERYQRFAETLKCVAVNKYLPQEKVKHDADVEVSFGGIDNDFITFFGENVNKIFAGREDGYSHDDTDAQRNHGAVEDAAADASDHARAVILCRIGGHGNAE